jgi:hypothetical protein
MNPALAIERLDAIPADHPCLWGELEVRDGEALQTWRDATLLPPRRRPGQSLWWRRHSFGVFNAAGQHLPQLSDMRGRRHCCHPAARLEDNPYKAEKLKQHELVLYGGTLYDQFGHLTLDLGRAYQLLRHHRNSDLPIWFHDATPHRHPRSTLKLDLVQAWLKQLGLRGRARLIRRPMRARQLISCGALYNDRGFASRDLRPACQAALKPRLRQRLEAVGRAPRRLAYLSRHKLSWGSTHYAQEAELVEQLAAMPHVDVICPEELDFEQKLSLYRRYAVVAGFPQACMGLKLFVPGERRAQQVMFIAGARSLSSTWVNMDRASGGGDAYVDCNLDDAPQPASGAADPPPDRDDRSTPFLRSNRFNSHTVLRAIAALTH